MPFSIMNSNWKSIREQRPLSDLIAQLSEPENIDGLSVLEATKILRIWENLNKMPRPQ